ncbi:MAG TPA: hypothetical protein VFA61_07555 [Candidatus Udaeobacter sp.]|nr:hypothetical protein [Candidatus Udaeobacter sp.]
MYEQRENIFVADIDGTHQEKIAAGALPEISPDGTRVAFNTEADAKTRPGDRLSISPDGQGAADGCRLRLGAQAQKLGRSAAVDLSNVVR